MVARAPDNGPRDFVRACEMFPGRRRSSHPTPAKGGCVPGYAASERLPGPGVWQRKTAAAKPAAATVRDSSEGGARRPGDPGTRGPPPGTGRHRGKRVTHRGRPVAPRARARDCTGPRAPGRGTREAPRPVTLRWAVREYQCEDSYSAMITAGMRPRSLTLWPRCLAQARISELRSRPGPLRARRRRPPAALARRACSV
jgi:hypothetical protein